MTKDKRHIKSIVKSFRIDEEMRDYINILDKHHISWQKLVYEEIKDIFKNRIIEFYNIKEERLPF